MLPNSLVKEISEGKGSLLLGAGASQEAGFPSAGGLANHLIEEAGEPYSNVLAHQPLSSVAEYLYQADGYGRAWVRGKIVDFFREKHKRLQHPPSAAHEFITTVRWRTIFTTNYDNIVEFVYQNSPDRVQRVLPVYESDPLVHRHESERTHLIKLNGSIDEAERNSNHELVLTFSEQQEARRQNTDFYQLLRTEAINGPIIFIGFRFAHPGTDSPGTSPEFSELKGLLREMGPAARQHYCVAPFDSESREAKVAQATLTDNNVVTVNANFGDFCQELKTRLTERQQPLSGREAISVPVSRTSLEIDPDEYDKDKRHFEVVGDHLQDQSSPTLKESLNGKANWGSFIEGHSIERLCKASFREQIDKAVSSAPEILFFTAPPGWGKTFLLRNIAVEYFYAARPVIWLNPYGTIEANTVGEQRIQLGTWDTDSIDRLIGRIERVAKENDVSQEDFAPIIIADDCAERASEALALFRSLARKNRHFVLLFSARDTDSENLLERYALLRRARTFRPDIESQSREEVQNLIDFCADRGVAAFSNTSSRRKVAQRIFAEGAHKVLLLALYVIFDKDHRPFSRIMEEQWEALESELQQDVVLRAAAIHRFGATLTPRVFSLIESFQDHKMAEVLEAYRACLRKGMLVETIEEGEPCVSTRHPLIADHIASEINNEADSDRAFIELVRHMAHHPIDLEMMRSISKRINGYEISLSAQEQFVQFFDSAAASSNHDWVICQQYANYLRRRGGYEEAMLWIGHAIDKNPDNASLRHTKGNILQNWAIKLRDTGKARAAEGKVEEARRCFSYSRVERGADEYGYVTHLDMLLALIRREENEYARTNLLAEGSGLYRRGLAEVEKDQYNRLLDEKYQRGFNLSGSEKEELLESIRASMKEGQASTEAAMYLVDTMRARGHYQESLDLVHQQRNSGDESLLIWVKEAEIHSRFGYFHSASQSIDLAKRREKATDAKEIRWNLALWELLIFVALKDYSDARQAFRRINELNINRKSVPQGYFWKEDARAVAPDNRNFREHAKVMEGTVKNIKPSGNYGQVELASPASGNLHIRFNPRYFSRGDLRRGDFLKFAIAILPTGLRAEDLNGDPFVNTSKDLFLS